MGRFIDLTGQQFGKLTVIEYVGKNSHNESMWRCKCSCSNKSETVVRTSDLRTGNTTTCGCGRIDGAKRSNTKHGLRGNPMYSNWKNMLNRCQNSKHKSYPEYGGRGIRVCDEWSNPDTGIKNFVKWGIENGYEKGLTIDRIDPDGDYCPENCRWLTNRDQQRNKRCNIKLRDGTLLIDYCEQHGLNYDSIYSRMYHGMPFEEAITKPKNKYYTSDGIPIAEYCRQHGKNYNKVICRICKNGWTVDEALGLVSRNRILYD